MNDAEFRSRASAFLVKHDRALDDENGRCRECGGIEGPHYGHMAGCERVALLAVAPDHVAPAADPDAPIRLTVWFSSAPYTESLLVPFGEGSESGRYKGEAAKLPKERQP